MAKNAYVGVAGKARKVKEIYVGVNGKARRVVKGYVGVNGVARQFWPNGKPLSAWQKSTLPATDNWTGVAYGNGRFVAVSASQRAAYTSNAVSWTNGTLPLDAGDVPWDITFGNGKFVVAARGGTGAYSSNGSYWTKTTVPIGNWMCIAYGGGKYVMLGQSGSAAYSADGITWQKADLPFSGSFFSVVYGEGKFVALNTDGAAVESVDGVYWSRAASVPTGLRAIAYGNGMFLAGGPANGVLFWSKDGGKTWNNNFIIKPAASVWGIAYGDSLFVAVGNQMSTGSASQESVSTTDAQTWTAYKLPEQQNWTRAAYGDGRFVVVSGYFTPANAAAYALVN